MHRRPTILVTAVVALLLVLAIRWNEASCRIAGTPLPLRCAWGVPG
jgi:hypothetical protein